MVFKTVLLPPWFVLPSMFKLPPTLVRQLAEMPVSVRVRMLALVMEAQLTMPAAADTVLQGELEAPVGVF